MRVWHFLVPPLSLVLLSTVVVPSAGRQTGGAKGPKKASPPVKEAGTYFKKYCVSCHNASVKSGALDLQTLQNADSFARRRDTWEGIVHRVRAGEMPPPGSPKPPEAETRALFQRIEREFEQIDRTTPPNPGAVTSHRLNRAEYNNTVQDLLGVNLRPADEFPQDDSGYGFDNIGDVLSLSPSQMEKYLSAAEKIARTAVFGPETLQPTLSRYEAQGRRIRTDTKIPAKYDTTGLDLINSLHASHQFPVEGEYLFKFHVGGLRPLGSEAVTFALWMDGKKVASKAFDPTGDAAFNPDRQDFSGRTVEFRLRVPAGDHWLAATIEGMYEGLPPSYNGPNPSKKQIPVPEFKPRPGQSPERIAAARKRFEDRLKEKIPTNDVRVSALEIGGPYAQVTTASEASLAKVFVCGHRSGAHFPECTPRILRSLASRAFRRPVTAPEVSRLARLVDLAQKQGDSYEEGICLAIQGILVSPHFLFRMERDPANIKPGTPHYLSQHELASRLSYFLWSTMPDEELRRCADQQTLRKPEVLAAQVRRMLKDPRCSALARNFGGQWLQFRALESAKPDRERYPTFDEYLRMSMRQETELFLESVIREDRSALDILFGKYTFLNGRLARFYGIPGVEGPAFRKVSLAGTNRGGVLTQGSILTVTSYPNRTSPVLRGKWILENILNAPPPAPPPGVPNLDTSSVGSKASLRKQLEEHRKNPTCASCHSRMDPLGFGLENFDAIGAWRKSDGTIPIDSSGSLPDGRTFQGPSGLKTVLKADQDAFIETLTTKLLTYALGRGLERYDRPTVKKISQQIAAKNYRFSELVLEIAASRPFQMRKGQPLQ